MYTVLDINDENWNLYLDKLPENMRDIYYTKDYYNMYQLNGDGIGKLFVYHDNNKIALYPFMINEIKGYNLNQKYYDIETAYGYGGPVSNCRDYDFLENFENSFLSYCKDENIIAEFIRFHPLLKNHDIFRKNIDVLHNRTTVYLDLSKGIEAIWKEDIKSKNRNMIRKAEKNGLTVEVSDDYETFKQIYDSTMNKVSADDYYYFSDDYFNIMKKSNNYTILNVCKEDKAIASAIFMGCGNYFHYHLSGSLKEYLEYAPNNILLWEAIKYAGKKGYKKMHFGGGLTDSLEDHLFKFKSSFSKETADFYIGKRVHNKEIYNKIINEWEKVNNKKAKILLQYKY